MTIRMDEIDGHRMAKDSIRLEREGDVIEGRRLRDEFVAAIDWSGDFCSCKTACPYHGKCGECVAIHRGHRDHVPACLDGI